MKALDLTQTMGEFIVEHPGCLLTFGELHCGSESTRCLTLGEFCALHRLDPAAIAIAVDEAGDPWRPYLDERFVEDLSVSQLIAYILATYHEPLQKEIPRLEELLEEALRTEWETCPELYELSVAFKRFKHSLERHIEDEEEFFSFLALLDLHRPPSLDPRQVDDLFRIIDREDAQIEADLEWLNRITRNYHVPAGAREPLRELFREMNLMELKFHRHESVENGVLFPKVMRLLRRQHEMEGPGGEDD